MANRETYRPLSTSSHQSGIKYQPYTYLPFNGLYTEDGKLLRGSEGQAKGSGNFRALATATPKNCCGQLRNP